MKTYIVGRCDGADIDLGHIQFPKFKTIEFPDRASVEEFENNFLRKFDPTGLDNGDYYLDD